MNPLMVDLLANAFKLACIGATAIIVLCILCAFRLSGLYSQQEDRGAYNDL